MLYAPSEDRRVPLRGATAMGKLKHTLPAYIYCWMAKQDSQLRRKQMLKQRKADEQREWDRQDAGFLFRDALSAHRDGDLPAAARLLKKALVLDPDHAASLKLLAEIHNDAGHHAEALAYLRRLQKIDDDPGVLYNIGFIYYEMGQLENAAGFMREFLAAVNGLRDSKWRRLRGSAEAICEEFRRAPRMEKPAPSPLLWPQLKEVCVSRWLHPSSGNEYRQRRLPPHLSGVTVA